MHAAGGGAAAVSAEVSAAAAVAAAMAATTGSVVFDAVLPVEVGGVTGVGQKGGGNTV